ncbi:UbiA family prenyltransferase [Verrucomicrobiaceae bacterium 227]
MRWWIYQKERFPLLANGLLVAAFSSCALLYSSYLGGGPLPRWSMFLVAFVTCLTFFLQLRIADEFKDAREDAQFRPYRPVPRGLVSLRELGVLFLVGALLQLLLSFTLAPALVFILILAWTYLALMSVEFFCRDWLKSRPITYLWTHMLIMPIVDFFATAAYWIPQSGHAPSGLFWFLAASFTNGLVIEIGRKIRPPEAEETGVPTYSKLWGLQRATLVWRGCLIATTAFATLAAHSIGTAPETAALLILAGLLVSTSRKHETMSGLWTLTLYLTLGILPLLIR